MAQVEQKTGNDNSWEIVWSNKEALANMEKTYILPPYLRSNFPQKLQRLFLCKTTVMM